MSKFDVGAAEKLAAQVDLDWRDIVDPRPIADVLEAACAYIRKLESVRDAVIEEEAALDACDRQEPGAPKRHAQAFKQVKEALAALDEDNKP